eukprot:5379721-Amphidinium_carterae.2
MNYRAFDHDADAKQSGFLEDLGSVEGASKTLGRAPALSRFGVFKQIRDGKVRHRVILDAKQSGVSASTASSYHVELPRASDGRVLVYHRTAQGSRNGPLTWTSIAALLRRVSQNI